MSSFKKKKEIAIDLYKFLDRRVEFVWFSPGPLKLSDGLTDLCTQLWWVYVRGIIYWLFQGKKISVLGTKFATNLSLKAYVNSV